MVFRIVVAGESQCDMFAKACLVADYLMQNLPDFCFERIEKSVLEWKPWLTEINQKHNWHHIGSPLVWKELLMSGSKPFYIGGAADFLEYCYSYYKFSVFMTTERFEKLTDNFVKFNKKDNNEISQQVSNNLDDHKPFIVCISGAKNPIIMYLISGLFEMSSEKSLISKIYIYDKDCSINFMEHLEKDCSFIATNYPGKTVKHIEKIGIALANSDILIIMDHVTFQEELSIGEWLHMNKELMEDIAVTINTTAAPKLRIIIPNLGPACYNGTILEDKITNVFKNKVVVATSDLGMNIAMTISEVADVPLQNVYCPPVWGFVGINHLIDIYTTIHRYDSFKPYDRFTKVKNSTLCIGTLTPEMRTLEYLLYFKENFWKKYAEKNFQMKKTSRPLINVALAALNTVNIWLFDPNPEYIVNLGIKCDGSFGLNFKGFFSQPSKLVDGKWKPASNFLLPKDKQISLSYLQEMAKMTMRLERNDLPVIKEYTPCCCKHLF